MMKIKLKLDTEATQGLLNTLFEIMRTSTGLDGLEVETLVLLDWHQRNYLKLKFTPLPCKIGMKPHEALSLRRVLFNLHLDDPLLDILRNELCGEIQKQVPHLN